jgi:hypothetical protein
MTTPATILRDSAIAGLVLSLAGLAWGTETGASIAAGALGSLVNLFLWWRAVSVAAAGAEALLLSRVFLKTAAGAVLLLALVASLPPTPVLVGFCSVMLGLAVRAFASLGGLGLPSPEQG